MNWPRDYPDLGSPPPPPAVVFPWRYDDGGRDAAGFPSHPDCGIRAAALATGLTYIEAYRALEATRPLGWDPMAGTPQELSKQFFADRGFTWVRPEGRGVRFRKDELPRLSPLVISMPRHLTVVVEGVILDVADPSRGGRGHVLGYWLPDESRRKVPARLRRLS